MTGRHLGDQRQLEVRSQRGPRVVRLIPILAIALITLGSVHVDSALPLNKPPKLRVLFVDAEHPATWPKGLEPIPAGELRRLLGDESDTGFEPRTISIEQAIYRATFRDGALRDGKAEMTLAQSVRSALVSLECPDSDASHRVTLSHLRWLAEPAGAKSTMTMPEVLCGLDQNGRRVAVSEPNASRLECDWSLQGRSSLGSTECALSVPPAVVSKIILHVPTELSVESDQGVLVRGPKDHDGKTVWQVELGSRSNCRLRFVAGVVPGSQRVFYDQDATLVVAPDRLRLQSKLQLDVFGAPLRSLRLRIPAGLRVETISYRDDFPLTVPANSPEKDREITLDLPEPLLGKNRTISVEASTATRTNQLWNLPQVTVIGAVRRESDAQLTIRAPLKLVRFAKDSAVAQAEAPTYTIDGEETFFLRQNAGDAPLAIEIAEPAPALAARTLARLDLRRDRCAFAADIVCSAVGGSTFSVAFELPAAWNVTRVEAVGDVSRMIDETTHTASDNRKRVKIDFFRAVTDREPKRFRVKASRPLPRSGEALDVPVIEFPTFASQEVETLIVQGSSIELDLSPAGAFAAFDPAAILAVLADSPLRPGRSPSGDTQMLTHRWTAQTAKARIGLRRGEEAFAARVRTTIDVNDSQIVDLVDATIIPASPIDRVLIYLSTEGSPRSWQLVSDPDRSVTSARLPAARHSEWNLPEGGELWEIRLLKPCRNEFCLRGTCSTSSLGGARIGLAFIPGASAFDGFVELRLPDARQFDVEARELHLSGQSTDGPRSVRHFQYSRPADALIVRPRPTGIAQVATRFASLQLTSFINAGGAEDYHTAKFAIAPDVTTQPFHFRLETESRLCSVAVNGQVIRIQRRGDDVTVPSLPAGTWNQVQIEYRTPTVGVLFRENRQVAVPRTDADILAFRWQVHLAPSLQPGAPPAGMRLEEPLPVLSWAERLFGPLGRSAAQMRVSSFTPDAWLIDLAGAASETENWTPGEARQQPSGWSSWNASAEQVPTTVSLKIWHTGKLRTLAWIVCFGCLSAGLIIVRLFGRASRRLFPVAVAVASAVAIAAPSPYALLAGAALSGTLFAVLLSRAWKTLPSAPAPPENVSHRPGSTITFEMRTAGLLLALGMLATAATFAQDAPRTDIPPRDTKSVRPPSDTPRAEPVPDGNFLVVIPARPKGQTAALPADKQLLYVLPAELEALRRRAVGTSRNEGILFLSSHYTVSFEERQPATIEATYRVALLPGRQRSLLLRLSHVTLAGADACRVNGRSVPVREDSEGIVLFLESDTPGVDAAVAGSDNLRAPLQRRPILADRPVAGKPETKTAGANPTLRVDRTGPRVLEIRLTCFPSAGAKPGQLDIQVPETDHTTVALAKSGPWQTATVEVDDGSIRQIRAANPPIDLGQTKRIQVKAGPAPAETVNTAITAQAAQFLRVSPGLVEMDCRVTYDRTSGVPDKFTWLVPAGAAVRPSADTYRAALRIGNSAAGANGAGGAVAEGLVPLDFDCSLAPAGPITLAATLLVPIESRQSGGGAPFSVPLPRFEIGTGDRSTVMLTSNQAGISAGAGYRVIAATTEPNLSHTAKADPTFRQESFGTRKEPDLILDCQGLSTLPLQLTAVAPVHKVRVMKHEARVSADHIQWRTTAEIRTESAPAFVHVLKVDRRLKVDSVSVREDDVERLVRFSQVGDEVTLFLRDRATATQDLVLAGRMPLELAHATKLPSVSLSRAVVADAHLSISHDPGINVVVADSPGVSRAGIDRGIAPSSAGDGPPRSSILEYTLSAGASMPEIVVTRRVEVAQVGHSARVAVLSNGKQATSVKLPIAPQQRTTQPAAFDSAAQKPPVEAAVVLDLLRDGSTVGSTHVLLDRFTQPTLRVYWPASAVLRGALVDGRPVQPIVRDGEVSLPVPSEPISHRLSVYWEARAASPLRLLARVREELPVPIDTRVNSVLLSVAAPAGFRLFAPTNLTPIAPQDFASQFGAIESGNHSAALEIAGSVKAASTETPQEPRLIGRLAIGPADAVISAWALDTFWLRLPLAAAIFALMALAAIHPTIARGGTWFVSHPLLTLAVVGSVWWLCLSPRAVGPLLLVVALGGLVLAIRRGQRERSSALPSTLHAPSASDVH
jgi:hypothetical protein